MIIKITKWLLLIIAFKMIVAAIVAQFYTDPRRDIARRKELCDAFDPNVVFIGTSRTLYGIDPAIFDSLNHRRTRSYNFGIFSLSPYSSIGIAEDLLSDNPAVRTIFIELSALDYSTVALPAQDVIPDAVFRAKVLADCPDIAFSDKARSFLDGLNMTLFQMVSIAPQILSAKKALKPENDPVEGNANLSGNGHQSVNAALPAKNERIVANESATKKLRDMHPSSVKNEFYITQINQLIARARGLGRQIIFYLPNNITMGEYRILSTVTPFVPAGNLISLPPQSLLDVLFKPANLFDAHHLNAAGAAVFTQYLWEEAATRQTGKSFRALQ